MAERVGFEPTIPVKVCPLSRRIVSTTHAPLRKTVASGQLSVASKSCRALPENLTALPKKFLHHLRGTSGQHPVPDVHLMIQTGVIHHLQNGMDGASLRVIRTIHQRATARIYSRSRAHGAGLNCSKQSAVDEPVVTDVSSCFTQRHDLSMSGWI